VLLKDLAPRPDSAAVSNGLYALASVTDPRSLVTDYTVDTLGNLTQQSSPDTGSTVNTYDAAGNWAPLKFRTLSIDAMMISEVSDGKKKARGGVQA
jgi:YD repeat-containing protein